MVVSFRQAEVQDLPRLIQLYIDTIRSICSKDYNEAQIHAWISSANNKQRWIEAIENQYFLIAQTESRIIGFGSLKDGEYIDFLYINKEYTGKGIAGRLFEMLEKESERLGKVHLFADVSITARPFFKKKGFRVQKYNYNILKGVSIVNYRMKR